MRKSVRAALIVIVPLAASAQQLNIEWRQVTNLPKGQNLPAGIKADILGIEVGDTYAEAKKKLEALLAEAPPAVRAMTESERALARRNGEDLSPPLTEQTISFKLSIGTASEITASYVGAFRLKREMPGSGPRKIYEEINAYLSAPSSGHQIIGVERRISYGQGDEPRVAELMARLKEKFGTPPQVFLLGSGAATVYRFQFNDGRAYVPPNAREASCIAQHQIANAGEVQNVNRTGDCDVVLNVLVRHGISPDHASSINFVLSDHERAKANVATDFTFFDTYVKELRARSQGVAPRL